MELSEIIPHIESLIFASDKPLTSLEITEIINNAFGFMEDKITLDQVEAAVEGVIEKYSSDFYPFEVRESGGGWQFLTKKAFHKTVAQLNGDKYLKRLSSASLETLSIIAYKQPITKGEIEAIRGVSTDYSIQKLLEKELILIIGRNEELPGKPLVYATSKSFMDYFGLNSAEDLPRIKEVLSDQIVVPTQVVDTEVQPDTVSEETVVYDEEGLPMIVSEDGELLERDLISAPDSVQDKESNPDTLNSDSAASDNGVAEDDVAEESNASPEGTEVEEAIEKIESEEDKNDEVMEGDDVVEDNDLGERENEITEMDSEEEDLNNEYDKPEDDDSLDDYTNEAKDDKE